MLSSLQIRIFENHQLVYETECLGPVELGRQGEAEEKPYVMLQHSGRSRIVLAPAQDEAISRQQLLIEELAKERVRLTNLSDKRLIWFEDGSELPRRESREVSLPVAMRIGRQRKVSIQHAGADESPLQSLARATIAPGVEAGSSRFSSIMLSPAAGMQAESLMRWLQAQLSLLQSAAGASDFFDKAARALVEMVDLDSGRVLLLEQGQWKVQAVHTAPEVQNARDWQASTRVLSSVLHEKRTFWQKPMGATDRSLLGVEALVAAPILNRSGEVIGALYGDRERSTGPSLPSITSLEAMLVELLAGGVATGLARVEQEQANLQRQKKFLQMEHELDIGRQIQAGFLPEELPQPPGWEVAAHFKPAREVSGDFYDVFLLPDDHLGLVVADVCDKGVGAALFMSLFRSLIRAFSQQTILRGLFTAGHELPMQHASQSRRLTSLLGDVNVLSTVELANNYVTRTHGKACMFASLFFGLLDTATGLLTYVNAGHDAPVLLGPDRAQARLTPTGPVVGLMPDVAYDLNKVQLQRGDTLIAYTDGVTEARDPDRKFFTEKRLLSILTDPAPSAAALLTRIVTNVEAHIAGADPFDDVTLLGVRWNG